MTRPRAPRRSARDSTSTSVYAGPGTKSSPTGCSPSTVVRASAAGGRAESSRDLCRLPRLELLLARGERPLPPLDRLALELDGAELAAAPLELGLLGAEARTALGDLPVELLDLGLALGEVRRPQAKHPLDGRAHVAEELLAALEVLHRQLEARGLLLELVAPLGEEPLELLLRARGVREHPARDVRLGARGRSRRLRCARRRSLVLRFVPPADPHGLSIARRSPPFQRVPSRRDARAGGPILSRRFGSVPPGSYLLAAGNGSCSSRPRIRGLDGRAPRPISHSWTQKAHVS